jgi:hypothetical protein
MIDVVLTSSLGDELTIDGSTKITYPIPSDMISNAPDNIPLWHFDESDGIWKEEGFATKVGSNYEGFVTHFSNWNFDVPGLEAGAEGRVVDCKGNPVANVLVEVGQQSTSTNSNGEFDIFVIAGQPHTAQVTTDFGTKEIFEIPSVSVSQVHGVGDITVCSSSISGKVIDCNGNPSQNILVSSNYSAFSYAYTDLNGEFSFFFPENTSTEIIAEGFFGTSSDKVSIPAISPSQDFNAGSIVLCNSQTGATSVAQDKQNIQNTFSSMENCISNLSNGYGSQAIKNFLNLDEGEVLSENWVENMIDNMGDFIDLDLVEDNNRFDFNSNTGTYTWNQLSEKWSKSSLPNDKIIIEFPSTESKVNNDAKFTFDLYTDIALYYDGETIWAPSSLHADLYIGNNRVFEINGSYIYDVGSPTPIPININTTLEFNPITIIAKGERVNSKEFKADVTIDDNTGCVTTLSAELKFKHGDYENIYIDEGDLISVNTTMTHGDMKIEGYLDGNLYKYNDVSNHQINAMVDVDVFYSGNKIGELILIEKSNYDEEVHMIYSDGSSDNSNVYYDPFGVNVEQILFPLFGDLDEL